MSNSMLFVAITVLPTSLVQYLPLKSFQNSIFQKAKKSSVPLFVNSFPHSSWSKMSQGSVKFSHSSVNPEPKMSEKCFLILSHIKKPSKTHTYTSTVCVHRWYIHTQRYLRIYYTWDSAMMEESNNTGQMGRKNTLNQDNSALIFACLDS